MDIGNNFADGKDALYNKRTRSPKDDRSQRYNNQRCRSRNYDRYSRPSQVVVSFRSDNNNQGDEHRSSGYHNDNRDEPGSSRPYRPKASRDYNQSPEDILNGSCNMHYIIGPRRK
jgi:hypothetical protein